ncbi:MAG: hypothetical protein NTX59_02310, partial [Elusimicrobia bacterium]|nr:hypothetical protein [Elusimicrobiota bacterium]
KKHRIFSHCCFFDIFPNSRARKELKFSRNSPGFLNSNGEKPGSSALARREAKLPEPISSLSAASKAVFALLSQVGLTRGGELIVGPLCRFRFAKPNRHKAQGKSELIQNHTIRSGEPDNKVRRNLCKTKQCGISFMPENLQMNLTDRYCP